MNEKTFGDLTEIVNDILRTEHENYEDISQMTGELQKALNDCSENG